MESTMTNQRYKERDISSTFEQAKDIEDTIIATAQECNFNSDDIFAIRLSMDEALANAIRHGNKKDETKKINLRYSIDPERVDIYITDEGDGFDPEKVPDPTTQENLEIPNGRGIMLMRAYMNKVEYNKKGNILHIVKLNTSNQDGHKS